MLIFLDFSSLLYFDEVIYINKTKTKYVFFFNIQVAHAFLNMYELYCSAITSFFSTKDL